MRAGCRDWWSFGNLKSNAYLSKNENLLLIGLCLVLALSVLGVRHWLSLNSDVIAMYELLFMSLYVIYFAGLPAFWGYAKENKLVSSVLALWLLGVTYSAFWSPSGDYSNSFAIQRYVHTVMHIFMFLFVWSFLRCRNLDVRPVFYAVPLATLCVAAVYVINWHVFIIDDSSSWFFKPPFNTHIRHAGIQVEAAICFFLAYFINKQRVDMSGVAVFAVLWALLFWMGGRGSILGALAAVFLVWVFLSIKKHDSRIFLKMVMAAVIVGAVIAELLAVFSWNGLSGAFLRSISADDMNELSSGRIALWMTSLASVTDHLFFGLGPQDHYYFTPERACCMQPHNALVQFLVEWGLVGALLFMSLLARGFYVGLRQHVLNRDGVVSGFHMAAGAVIISLCITSLVDGTFYFPQPSLYLAIAFAAWITPNAGLTHVAKI